MSFRTVELRLPRLGLGRSPGSKRKRPRRSDRREPFLETLEFDAVLEHLDGWSLYWLGCADTTCRAIAEAHAQAVVRGNGWLMAVGQSARARVASGGVFIDGVTAYHDATTRPFNYQNWFNECTTHSTLRVDAALHACDDFRSIVAVGFAEPPHAADAAAAAAPLAYAVRARALEGYEVHVGVVSAAWDRDASAHPAHSDHSWFLDLRGGAFVRQGGGTAADAMFAPSTDEAFAAGDTVGVAIDARGRSVDFYRNGRRLAGRCGAGGWGRSLPEDASLAPAISISRTSATGRNGIAASAGDPALELEIGAWAPPDPAKSRRRRLACAALAAALYAERVTRVAARAALVPVAASAFGDALLYSTAWTAAWQDHVLKRTDGRARRSRRGLRTVVRLHVVKIFVVSALCAVVVGICEASTRGPTLGDALAFRDAAAWVAYAAAAYAVGAFLDVATRLDRRGRSVNIGVVFVFLSFFFHNWAAHDGWVVSFLAPAPLEGGSCVSYLGDDALSHAAHQADLFATVGSRRFASERDADATRAKIVAYPLWSLWLALEVLVDVEIFRHVGIDENGGVLWRSALPVGRPAALPVAAHRSPPDGGGGGADADSPADRDAESQRMFAASVVLPLTILHCFHVDARAGASSPLLARAAAFAARGGPAAVGALYGAYALLFAYAFAWAVYQWHVVLGLLKRLRDLLRVAVDDATAADRCARDAAHPFACLFYPFRTNSPGDQAFVVASYVYVVLWLYGGWYLGFSRPDDAAWRRRAFTWPFSCDHAGLDLTCLG